MRALIVGGGEVGAYLAEVLGDQGHAVSVIESESGRASAISEETKAMVLMGDGTDIQVLRNGDVHRADWVLAVTGRDEDNIVACQLATTLGAKRVLARLNDPKNRATFDALDIPVVGVSDLIAKVISAEVEVDVREAVRVALIGRGQVSLLELEIPLHVSSRKVIDLQLPHPTILVTVMRGDEVIVPGAETMIEPGDRVLAVTNVELEVPLREVLCPVA